MTRRIVVRPQARIELLEAAEWYDTQAQGLGARFLRAFDTALIKIMRNPLRYQRRYGAARRATLRPFPYGLIFRVSGDEILIVACVHDRRDPAVWQGRL